jgi:hypothetical protein
MSDFAHQILMAAGEKNRTNYLELFLGGEWENTTRWFLAPSGAESL